MTVNVFRQSVPLFLFSTKHALIGLYFLFSVISNPFTLIIIFGRIFTLKMLLALSAISGFLFTILLSAVLLKRVSDLTKVVVMLSILTSAYLINSVVNRKYNTPGVPNSEAISDVNLVKDAMGFIGNKSNRKYTFTHLYFQNPVQYNYKNTYSVSKTETGVNARDSVNYPTTDNSTNIWFFGGSTMYSLLTSNQHTIPSLFAKIANVKGTSVHVTNYGISAFNSSLELINYVDLLRRVKDKPEIVVFYDGYNDSTTSLAYGAIQINQQATFGAFGDNSKKAASYHFIQMLNKNSYIFKRIVGNSITYKYFLSDQPDFSNRSINETAQRYISNVKYIEKISEAHGIKPYFFLQPMPFTKKDLSHEEKQRINIYHKHSPKVYNIIKNACKDNSNFFDLSDAFDEYKETLFFDRGGHVHNKGNSIIAAEMFNTVNKYMTRNYSKTSPNALLHQQKVDSNKQLLR